MFLLYSSKRADFNLQMVVKKDSAVAGFAGEMVVSLDADHHGVCKYPNRTDMNYTAVRSVLRRFVYDFTRKVPQQDEVIRHFLGITSFSRQIHDSALRSRPQIAYESLLSNIEFQSWLCARTSQCLWVHGPSGAGKSALSTFVSRHLAEQENLPCAFGCVTTEETRKPCLEAFLRTSAYQFATCFPAFRRALANLARRRRYVDYPDWYLIWKEVFVQCLFDLSIEFPIYWVIDGIDDGPDSAALVSAIAGISTARMSLNILFTSRWKLQDLTHPMDRMFKVTSLDIRSLDGVKTDLESLATAKIQRMPGIQDPEEIVYKVLSIANGDYVYMDLLCQAIAQCRRYDRLNTMLKSLSLGVVSCYQQMERDLRPRCGPDEKVDIKAIMPWVAFVIHPLRIETINQALQYLGVPPFMDLRGAIDRVCGGFVTVDEDSLVRLVHPTVRDYITTQKSVLYIDDPTANYSIFEGCLRGLKSLAILPDGEVDRKEPFLEYAAKFWQKHLRESDAGRQAWDLLESFFTQQAVLVWIYRLASEQDMQTLVDAGLALRQFISRAVDLELVHSTGSHFIDRCSIDLIIIAERFSEQLLKNPKTIFNLIPLFCPSSSFVQFVRPKPKIFIDGFFPSEWDDYLATFPMPDGRRASRITSSDHNFVISMFSPNGTVGVYNMSRTRPNFELVHGEPTTALKLSRSGKELVTYGLHTTKLWDVKTSELVSCWPNPLGVQVLAITFTNDNQRVVVFCGDGNLRTKQLGMSSGGWEVSSLELDGRKLRRMRNPSCAAFNADSDLIAIGYHRMPVEVFRLSPLQLIGEYGEGNNPSTGLKQVCWNSRSDRIIGLQKLGPIFMWLLSSDGSCASQSCAESATTMQCSPMDDLLVLADGAGSLKVRCVEDLSLVHQFQGSKNVARISIEPSGRKVYDIRGTDCTVWDLSLFRKLAGHSESRSPLKQVQLASHTRRPGDLGRQNVTALALCPQSSGYCAGYANGRIEIHQSRSNAGFSKSLESPTTFEIQHILWSDDQTYLAAVDIARQIFIWSYESQNQEFSHMTGPSTRSNVEQVLFDPSSRNLLIATAETLMVWSMNTQSETVIHHELGNEGRWIRHPRKSDMLLGSGPRKIELISWNDTKVHSSIVLENSISEIGFGLDLYDSVQEEESIVCWDPTSGTCKVQKVLTSNDGFITLLFTLRESHKFGRRHQLLMVPTTDIDEAARSTGQHVRPLPVFESLSDTIALPLGFVEDTEGSRDAGSSAGGRLVYMSEDGWICTVIIDLTNTEQPIKRHMFLPEDWSSSKHLMLCRVRNGGDILVPRLEKTYIIRNALDSEFNG